MILKTEISLGPQARDRLAEMADPSARGAEAALETFFYAWHQRDAAALRDCWSASPFAEVISPGVGTVRGGEAIAGLYKRAMTSRANPRITFDDVVAYFGESDVVYAGRETSSYTAPDGSTMTVEMRCTRYFRDEGDHWRQYLHHASTNDPDALRAYQQAFGR
jgi:ketosteroid isomerase-like protein